MTFQLNSILINYLTLAAYGKSQPSLSEESLKEKNANLTGEVVEESSRERNRSGHSSENINAIASLDQNKKGMVLPFTPLALTFENIRYSVDMPQVFIHLQK